MRADPASAKAGFRRSAIDPTLSRLRDRAAMAVAAGLGRATVFLLDRIMRAFPATQAPEVSWPEPSGPLATGVRDVVDAPEAGVAREGSERPHVSARVWYPARLESGARRAPLLHPGEGSALLGGAAEGIVPGALVEQMERTRAASWQDAPLLEGQGRPLVVFSHGMGGVASQNTHLCEDLASHGYIVFSLAHPSGAAAVRWLDESFRSTGMVVRQSLMDPQVVGAAMALRRADGIGDRLSATRRLATLPMLQAEQERWVGDIRVALDWLDRSPTLFARELRAEADLNRIALVGMSFGGSASAVAAQADARIKAVVNLDGGQFGDLLIDAHVGVPLLMMQSDDSLLPGGASINDFHYEPWTGADTRRPPVYRYHVKGSRHLSFSDLVLFGGPVFQRLTGIGRLRGERMLALTASITRRFLNRWLVLQGADREFPGDILSVWQEVESTDRSWLRQWAQSR